MGEGVTPRLTLRVDLVRSGQRLDGELEALSESSAVVRTVETLYLGDRIRIRLSFCGQQIVELESHVVAHHAPRFVGHAPSVTVAVVIRSEDERARLGTLLRPAPEVDHHRLLVADGNRLLLQAFARYVQRQAPSLAVALADRADLAWDLLCEGDIDLVIVDSALADTEGAGFIDRIRSDPRFDELSVVATSARGTIDHKPMLAAGADLFLHKPLSPRDVFATLARVRALGSYRWPTIDAQ